MRILLTGATGFIGRWLIPGLLDSGHEVCAVVRSSSDVSSWLPSGVSFFCDDGTRDLEADLAAYGPFDGVIHLASLFLSSHEPSDVGPLVTSNILFPARVLDACARAGVQWFVNTGTIWQHFEGRSYSPVNLYAATKQAFETVAQYYAEAFGLRVVTLALGDTYGPGDVRRKLLNLWCLCANGAKPLEMSDGWQQIDPVYCSDVADAYVQTVNLLGAEEAWPETNMSTFLVSSKSPLSLRELASVFEEVADTQLLIQWGKRPMRPREVMKPWDLAPTVPGWRPKVALREGLRLLWLSTQKQNKEHHRDE